MNLDFIHLETLLNDRGKANQKMLLQKLSSAQFLSHFGIIINI